MKLKLMGILVASALAGGTLAGVTVQAAEPAQAQAHSHGEAAHTLKLNDGKKWETDAPLRDGMAKIGAAVDSKLPALGKAQEAAQFDALAGEIDTQLASIVQNCKLEPAADEVLHVILAEMMEGNEALRAGSGESRMHGVERVVDTLKAYAEHFDHPGFEVPHAAH